MNRDKPVQFGTITDAFDPASVTPEHPEITALRKVKDPPLPPELQASLDAHRGARKEVRAAVQKLADGAAAVPLFGDPSFGLAKASVEASAAAQISINPLEPFKAQMKAQGYHLTRRVRDKLDALEFDRTSLVRLLSRGYLSDTARQEAARVLAGRVFDAMGVGR